MGGTSSASEEPHRVAPLLQTPDRLCTVYQPIVELRTGALAGYEALTRIVDWPARSPQPWFEAATRAGLGGELEAAAIRQALRARPDLPEGLFLSLNVGPAALDDPAVLKVLLDEPDLHGLLLELTSEGPAARPGTSAVPPSLADLRVHGALVAVDVADAGLTDLLTLDGVRPDVVQLAGSLVRSLHGEPVRERLIRLIVEVAAELDAVTLAGGVESHDEARHLQHLGVTHGQGWLFGRARPGFLPPSAEACTWLADSWHDLVEHGARVTGRHRRG